MNEEKVVLARREQVNRASCSKGFSNVGIFMKTATNTFS